MKGIKQFFKGFKKGMGNFGYNLALIINTILLAIVYFFARIGRIRWEDNIYVRFGKDGQLRYIIG